MTDAEKTVQKMMEPVLRFALKRCRCAQDAEDLAQEILCRAYAALCRGGVEDGEKFATARRRAEKIADDGGRAGRGMIK